MVQTSARLLSKIDQKSSGNPAWGILGAAWGRLRSSAGLGPLTLDRPVRRLGGVWGALGGVWAPTGLPK